jgi:hypothetical protein
MDESIGGMPDEQETRLVRGRSWKKLSGRDVANGEDSDGSKQRPDGRRTDKSGRWSGFQWVRHDWDPIRAACYDDKLSKEPKSRGEMFRAREATLQKCLQSRNHKLLNQQDQDF